MAVRVGALQSACGAEINENRLAVFAQQDIVRLDIAVDEPLCVKVTQRAEDFFQYGQKPFRGDVIRRRSGFVQIRTFHMGHYVVGRAEGFKGIAYGYYVWVAEA